MADASESPEAPPEVEVVETVNDELDAAGSGKEDEGVEAEDAGSAAAEAEAAAAAAPPADEGPYAHLTSAALRDEVCVFGSFTSVPAVCCHAALFLTTRPTLTPTLTPSCATCGTTFTC